MVHSAKTFGAKLLFALSIPLLVLASLPLGLYAFFLYAKGIVDTIRGRKPSIVTEFDEVKRQGPSSFPDPFGANPIPQGVINSNNTIDSHDVTNSNNTTQTTNYYFNGIPPFSPSSHEGEKEVDPKSVPTFTPKDAYEGQPQIIQPKVKAIDLSEYRSLSEGSKRVEEGGRPALPPDEEGRVDE